MFGTRPTRPAMRNAAKGAARCAGVEFGHNAALILLICALDWSMTLSVAVSVKLAIGYCSGSARRDESRTSGPASGALAAGSASRQRLIVRHANPGGRFGGDGGVDGSRWSGIGPRASSCAALSASCAARIFGSGFDHGSGPRPIATTLRSR
jgi:hypothetical protein